MAGPIVATSAAEIKETRLEIAESYDADDPFPGGHKGAVIGTLNKYMARDSHRRIAIAWLYDYHMGEMSTKKLNDGQWFALYEWIGFWNDDDGWHVSPTFSVEAYLVLSEALKWYATLTKAQVEGLEGPDKLPMAAATLDGVVIPHEGARPLAVVDTNPTGESEPAEETTDDNEEEFKF